MSQRNAGIANLFMGIWMIVSAFLWSHSTAQFNNAWVVGVLGAGAAAAAMAAPPARYLNTALAIWLFVSTWALPVVSQATVWNSAIVALLMVVFSLAGLPRERHVRSPHDRSRDRGLA